MAFYQILFFRKKAYIRKIQIKYAEDRHALVRNIFRKRKQISDAVWAFHTRLLLFLCTGGVSGGFSVLHLRKVHIARQKLNALEKLYEEMYAEKPPAMKLSKAKIAKRSIIFGAQSLAGISGMEDVIGETDVQLDFELEFGDDDAEGASGAGEGKAEEESRSCSGAKEEEEEPMSTDTGGTIALDEVVDVNM